ncbi:MAG: T9SS type A sorting domain-containing protein [Bacteroidota bacterium]
MRRKNLLVFALTLFLLPLQSFLADSSSFLGAQTLRCDPVETAGVNNLTPNSFDLYWTALPNTNSYYVDTWVNGTAVYSTITQTTMVNVLLANPLQVGDVLVYHIYRYCDHGGIADPYRGEFPIIATEDIVMIHPGGIGPLACHCLFLTFPIEHAEEMYKVYDCPCIQEHIDVGKCPMIKAAVQITHCSSGFTLNPTPLQRFYPNPFSHQLTADFELPQAGVVSLSILDHQGRIVRSIIEEEYFSAGPLRMEVNTTALEKGLYYYVLSLDTMQWLGRLVRL